MKTRRPLAAMAAIYWLATGAASAVDVAPAGCSIAGYELPANVCTSHNRTIASTCFNCHGPNGMSQAAIPSLAGQDKHYLVSAMKDFRDGKREATVMQKYAKGYTDAEYEELAALFAAMKLNLAAKGDHK